MEKDFVPYDRAFRMKALGFDWDCFASYNRENVLSYDHVNNNNLPYFAICSAPTFSQAFRWFREKYNLIAEFNWHFPSKCYATSIYPNDFYLQTKSYEEAELACLDKLIEIVENV